ncbi:MAG: type II and III secretion system protein [Acidobacteriales bacterium]|nr:type II and III secretion system protein [Terriglobales bacterium]
MKRLLRTLWFPLLILLMSGTLAAESPRSLYNKGKQAETKQDYVAAYEAYIEAYKQKPTELKYRTAAQRTRFWASATHVNRGQALRDQGKLAEALSEFEIAQQIDPSNFAADQEMKRTRALVQAMESSGGQPPPAPPPQSPISKRLEEAAEPVDLAPVSPAPITLEIANDSKMVYETIGALDILAFNSNTFWRPITSNTIYVAANTAQKRKELEQSVLKTFYLSNLAAATDLQDVVQALRQILEIQKVQPVNSQSAIIVRGTPDQIALAEKIINDIDKARPEVIVDIAIMQVRRDKVRNLGAALPTSGTIGLAGTTSTSTGTGTGTTSTTNPNTINLNSLANLKATNFIVTIPSATANFLFTDSDSKLIQNPQIRASDGQKASLKIGDRVPIATGSVGNPIGGTIGAVNSLVNTQFQYIDVGVNIDITPRVYQGREIGLKLSLDVSSVTGSSSIGGINQPIISQRKIEHDIRLKEGEVNLLGGIFEDTDTRTIQGLPWLAQLPFFKYFFGSERKERLENEIVFVLIPRIVRGPEISDLNQRTIDIGTANAIDLRRVSRPATPATPATQTPVTPSQQPQQPPVTQPQSLGPAPVTAPPPSANAAAKLNTGAETVAPPSAPGLRMDPPSVSQGVGSTFSIQVTVSGISDLYSAPMQISYDPKVLQLTSISNGDLLSRDGQPAALVHREDTDAGLIQANASRPPGAGGISGDGVIYTLTFLAKAKGDTQVTVQKPNLRNSQQQTIALGSATAVVSVK